MKIPKTRMEYIEYYAEKLKNNSSFFEGYIKFINSQYQASREIFQKRFGEGEEFKKNAREYLKGMNLIK